MPLILDCIRTQLDRILLKRAWIRFGQIIWLARFTPKTYPGSRCGCPSGMPFTIVGYVLAILFGWFSLPRNVSKVLCTTLQPQETTAILHNLDTFWTKVRTTTFRPQPTTYYYSTYTFGLGSLYKVLASVSSLISETPRS